MGCSSTVAAELQKTRNIPLWVSMGSAKPGRRQYRPCSAGLSPWDYLSDTRGTTVREIIDRCPSPRVDGRRGTNLSGTVFYEFRARCTTTEEVTGLGALDTYDVRQMCCCCCWLYDMYCCSCVVAGSGRRGKNKLD